MVTDHRGLRGCRGCAFRKHCGHTFEVTLRARPPLLMDHPQHLVFRGNHAQRDIWVPLAQLEYNAQRRFSLTAFRLGVLISQDHRTIEGFFGGSFIPCKRSSCPASPSGGHSLLCKYPQELLASQQHLAPASSNLLILNGVGGWASMTLHTQRPGYRFTLQCWQAREANGQGRKEGGMCERD